MSAPIEHDLAFATEETYLHATDRVADDKLQILLVVEVGHEIYGLQTDAVREIIKVGEITEVPRTPDFLLGVMSVRGAIIPVLDLRLRLGFPAAPIARATRTVIVNSGGQRFGLRVDAVLGLERFKSADIEQAPAIFGGARGGPERYVLGVGRTDRDKRIVVFLDLSTLLSFADELAARRDPRRRRDLEQDA